MSARSNVRVALAHVRGLLNREDWIYLLSLLVPLCLYNVSLKVIRIVTQLDAPGPLGFLDQIRSDVLFNLGYAALWVGLFALFRSGVPRVILLVIFHLSAMLLVVLTTSAQAFYQTTGSILSWSYVSTFLASFGELQGLIASEITALHLLVISAVLLYGIAGPAVVTRLFSSDWHVPTGTAGHPWLAPLVACLGALGLAALSLLPSATGAGNAFSRDVLANMVLSELTKPKIETKLTAQDLPTNTKFVPTSETEKRNVVVVYMESTRAESVTPYEKDLDTTPFMNDLSKESLMAERAYAVVPHTSKALVASQCGVAPPLDTKNTEAEPDVIPAQCIPDLLGEQGYRSVFFQSATENFERRRMLVDNFGYDDFFPLEAMNKEGYQEANYFGYEDDIMLDPSRKWLEENAGKGPFFASYLTITAHHNYGVPDRYGKKDYSDDEVVNRYQNTVRYQDFFLKNLFQQYKDMGLYEDTVFIVLGDHGEGFGEHDRFQHDNVIYNEGLRIPLFVHDPRNPEARRIEAPVNELDVLPTVADLLGYDIGGGTYPGFSILDPPKDRTLMASCYQEQNCLTSIQGDDKYIYHYGNKGEEFFDLSKDSDERKNIIDKQDDEKIKGLRNDLLAWESKIKAIYEQRLESNRERTSAMEKTTAGND